MDDTLSMMTSVTPMLSFVLCGSRDGNHLKLKDHPLLSVCCDVYYLNIYHIIYSSLIYDILSFISSDSPYPYGPSFLPHYPLTSNVNYYVSPTRSTRSNSFALNSCQCLWLVERVIEVLFFRFFLS